ncbi:potassium/proton antiporter [Porcipelethomonas sp.]|uniref:potassium/proton antiporter n=1 Tax=Porcipelethomonas sp. TaxID=2981675 RepID=UPI003EF9AF50
MALALLISSIVIIICVIFNRISNKIGIPVLIAFIGLGMLFGSDGLLKIPFENYDFAEKICSAALIFIMFYGGFGTNWSEARPVAAKSIMLSTLGVAATAGLTGLFCFYILGFPFLESMLVGSVISSTDAASVFSILRSKKLGLKENTASLLEIESGSNDPCSYMLTAIILSIMKGNANGGEIVYLIFAQFAYGLIFGFAIAFAARFFLRRFKFSTEGFDAAFVLAIAILAYALPSIINGNGYLSTYIVGIILGNSDIKNKKSMVHFFDGLTGLMQMLIFFLLGLLSLPSSLPKVFPQALAISLFLMLIARPLVVFGILTPMKCSVKQQLLVSWSGLRGAASIVFAIMAVVTEDSLTHDIFHIVFCIVLISITVQGSLIPFMAKVFGMTDDSSDVLKTFNDYVEELDIQFIKLTIKGDHPWKDKRIRELSIPWDLLFVLIIRGDKSIIPNGKTKIKDGDIVVVSAQEYHGTDDIQFIEYKITHSSNWIGKNISDFAAVSKNLVILIKRGSGVVIPRGPTPIMENDILVLHAPEEIKIT